MDELTPYREAARVARFVCLSCYRSLSTTPGQCFRCEVERMDLAVPEVRDDVRAEVRRKLEARLSAEKFGVVAVTVAITLAAIVGAFLKLRGHFGDYGGLVLVISFGCVFGMFAYPLLLRLFVALRHDSAVANYAARRYELSQELGADTDLREPRYYSGGRSRALARIANQFDDMVLADDALARGSTGLDVEMATITELLQSLGAKIEV